MKKYYPKTTIILCCIILTGVASAVVVKPANISIPSPGGTFSFDFVMTGPPSRAACDVQLTIDNITGPSLLTFNPSASEAIENDPGFWVYGNSAGAASFQSGNSYVFGDGANNPTSSMIDTGDTIARFAFTWNGTPGDYVFNLNGGIAKSFVFLDDFSSTSVWLPYDYWWSSPIIGATADTFTIRLVPEPVSIALFGLGGLAVLRKRRA